MASSSLRAILVIDEGFMDIPRFAPDDDIINICWDNVFKAVFTRGTPESTGALSRLLSAIIGRGLTVNAITVNEPAPGSVRDRQVRFDINCTFTGGELANVEMTLNPSNLEPLRIEFYACRLHISQDIRGTEKSYDDLRTSYQVSLLVNKTFFGDTPFAHSFEFYDAVNKVSLGGRVRIFTVELEKINNVLKKQVSNMTPAERWAVFFRYITETNMRGIINEILECDEGVRMAGQVLLTISKDQEERLRLMSEYKAEVDRQAQIVDAKREARREIARNLLRRGLTPQQISEDTGLSIESITNLINNDLTDTK